MVTHFSVHALRSLPSHLVGSSRRLGCALQERLSEMRQRVLGGEMNINPIVELLVEVETDAQVMASCAADFANETWTFRSVRASFQCGAGQYVVIPIADWEAFKNGLLAHPAALLTPVDD